MDDLTRRNTETVRLTLKDMLQKVHDQDVKINGLNATISGLNSRMDDLQRNYNLLRAMLTGSGPTSR